jgi:GGDEF domain-containing protein
MYSKDSLAKIEMTKTLLTVDSLETMLNRKNLEKWLANQIHRKKNLNKQYALNEKK